MREIRTSGSVGAAGETPLRPDSVLLDDPSAIRRRFGVEDVLEQNIRILMQVSNAISFAHSRGIVHRDIKPANVMVGLFGEIYVVDWGLALASKDDGSGRIPTTSGARFIAGTPAYMAPEQAYGSEGVGPWTDVYLLGATLYEVAVGCAPHRGETLMQLMLAIAASEPELPEKLPPASSGARCILIRTSAMARRKNCASRSALSLSTEGPRGWLRARRPRLPCSTTSSSARPRAMRVTTQRFSASSCSADLPASRRSWPGRAPSKPRSRCAMRPS
jgi:serine/threonine protein kinase